MANRTVFNNAVNLLYQSAYDHQAHCVHNDVDDWDDWDDLDDAFENLIKDIHKGKGREVNQSTVEARAKILTDAMTEGYSKKTAITVDYDSPDQVMLRQLKENIWIFSGAVDEQMTKDLSALLIDKNGKLRSEADFLNEAAKIGKIYNRDRLRVERNHAIATSQMAARWVEYQKDIDILPNLRYKTVGDDRVRQSHKALDNIVRSITDSFWNIYYPPNDWGCRCDVQAEDGEVTDLEDKNLPILKPLFKTNLAKSGVLYPDGHPYLQKSTEAVLSFSEANYKRDNIRIGKGAVYESGLALDPTKLKDARHLKDYYNKIEMADVLANYLDNEVYVTPESLNKKDWRYKYFFDNVPVEGKKPDYKIGNDFWELEGYEGRFKPSKIKDMIESGVKQSDKVVLKVRADINERSARKQINDYMNRPKAVKPSRVILIDRDNNILVDYTP